MVAFPNRARIGACLSGMKTIRIALALVAALGFSSLAACGKKDKDKPAPKVTEPAPEQPKPEQPKPEEPKPEEPKPEGTKPEEAKPEGTKPEGG